MRKQFSLTFELESPPLPGVDLSSARVAGSVKDTGETKKAY